MTFFCKIYFKIRLQKSSAYDKIIVYTFFTSNGDKMKRLERTLLAGCGYTVLILTLFYAFAAVSKFTSAAITFPTYLLITGFGFIISFAELMYNSLQLKNWIRGLIHYGVLLTAFIAIFIISGNIKSGRASAIFAAIILFTMLYFAFWGVIHLVKKTVTVADERIDAKAPKIKEAKPTKEYKPLYGREEK